MKEMPDATEELTCEDCGMAMAMSFSKSRNLCEYCYKEQLMQEEQDWADFTDWQDAEWEAKQAAQH